MTAKRRRIVVESVSPSLPEILAALDGMTDEEIDAYWNEVAPKQQEAMVRRAIALREMGTRPGMEEVE